MAQEASHTVNWARIALTLGFIAAFFTFVFVFTRSINLVGGPSENRVRMDEDLAQGWTTTDGHLVRLGHLGDIAGIYENGITIRRRLPSSIESGAEFNFLSKNCTLEVLYDGESVYTFMPDPAVYGKPYEEYFNYVPLDPSDAGKQVTIRIAPAYPDVAVRLTDVRVSGTSTYIQHYLHVHGAAFIVSLTIFFMGLAMLALLISLGPRVTGQVNLRSLSAISIFLGTWSATETLIPQLVTGMRPLWQALNSGSLLFVPYPMFCFGCSLVRIKRRRIFETISLCLAVTAFAHAMIGALVFGQDLHQLLVVSHAHLVLQCFLFAIAASASVRSWKQNPKTLISNANKPILVSFFIMLAFALIDFVIYVSTNGDDTDPARFMRVGLFIFTAVVAIETFKTSMDFVRRAVRVEEIEAIAYTDALTGIANRTAWQNMEQKIDEALRDGITTDALVCQLDVNFLKTVNDTMGHGAGDEHLRRAATTIKRSFGTEGACYRTGGDEFTVLLLGVSLDERALRCEELLRWFVAEQQKPTQKPVPLSIAYGKALVSECGEHTLHAAQELADKRMYDNKRAMKGLG